MTSSSAPSILSRFTPASFFHLQRKVSKLEREVENLKQSEHTVRIISEAQADSEVMAFIQRLKKAGRSSVSDFEVAETLNLPLDQVDAVLDKHSGSPS